MSLKHLWILILQIFLLMIKYSQGNPCQINHIPKLATRVDSPYSQSYIGEKYHLIGFFPAKLKAEYNRSGFVWIEAAKFAFLELLKYYHDSGLQINLDLLIFDSCNQINIGSMQLLNLLLQNENGNNFSSCCDSTLTNNIIGIIGPASSSITDHFLNILSNDLYPVISYSATSVRFDDKSIYPTFLRTIPPDNLQARLILDLVLHYNWTYISVVAQDNEYGRMGMDELRKLLVRNGVCTFLESVYNPNDQQNAKNILEQLKQDSLSNVIVLWASGPATQLFLKAAEDSKLFDKVFILSEATNENTKILYRDPKIAQGILSIVPDSGVYYNFEQNFRKMSNREHAPSNPWLKYFFQSYMNVDPLSSNENIIEDFWGKLPMTKNGNVYNAVFAFGEAIKKFIESNPSCNNTSTCLKKIVYDRRAFFNQYLQTVVFNDLHGFPTTFDAQGNQNSTRFLLSTPQPVNGHLVWKRVGQWNKNLGLHISKSFYWPNNKTSVPKSRCGSICSPGFSHQTGPKECCWKCVPCQENQIKANTGKGQCTECPTGTYANKERTECKTLTWDYIDYNNMNGILLMIAAFINISITIFFSLTFIIYRKTPVVISSQKTMTSIQLVFLGTFNFIVLLAFRDIDRAKCLYYGTLTPFLITFAVSPTIIKTQRLTTVFKAKTRLNKRRHVIYKDIVKIIILLLIQSGIVIISLVFGSVGETITTINKETMEIRSACRFQLLFYMQILYLIIIFTICGFVAFRARDLPTNYNETRVIAHAMFTCGVILIFTFPLRESMSDIVTKRLVNNYTFLLIDFTILMLMYSPKVWVILFRPNLNTAHHFQMTRMEKINHDITVSCNCRQLKATTLYSEATSRLALSGVSLSNTLPIIVINRHTSVSPVTNQKTIDSVSNSSTNI